MFDLNLVVRKDVVLFLNADAAMVALVAGRVTGPEVVPDIVWPFVRYSYGGSVGYEATELDGGEVRPQLHVFAETEDACTAVCAELVQAVMLRWPEATRLNVLDMRWDGTQVLPDTGSPPVAGGYHGICDFTVTAVN